MRPAPLPRAFCGHSSAIIDEPVAHSEPMAMPTAKRSSANEIQLNDSAVNPVVSRDGRSVILNEGFFDPGNGGSITWDAKFSGYEGDTANAAMQPQAN